MQFLAAFDDFRFWLGQHKSQNPSEILALLLLVYFRLQHIVNDIRAARAVAARGRGVARIVQFATA